MDWIIGLPALGHTAEGGTVREWLKSVGDTVTTAEPIVVVESDKVSLEIEAPGTGVLLEISVPVGTEVPTGTVLGRIGAPGSRPAPPEEMLPIAESSPQPAAFAMAVSDAPAATPATRQMVTPLARRFASDQGIDLSTIAGRGRYGQIRKADVLEAVRMREDAASAERGPPDDPAPLPSGLTPMRRAISRRMTEAWRNQPMVTLARAIDVTTLMEWRATAPVRASLTAVLATAMARTLVAHPKLNGTIDADGIRCGGPVNLAIAVALDDGLAAPVVRLAHTKSLASMDADLASLVHMARNGQLQTQHLSDATASISNLGPFGIETFTPILTPPQIMVLGVGTVERVLREMSAGFAFRSMLNVSLTIDHRAVDGADGARFLQGLDAALQAPAQLLLPAL